MQLVDFKPADTFTTQSTTPRSRLYIKARTKARARFWSYHDRGCYECPSCGRGGDTVDGPWHVHHKDRDPLNNEYVNLVAVCVRCHRKAHRLDAVNRRLRSMRRDFHALGGVPA